MKHKKKCISLILLAFLLILPTVPEVSATWQTDGSPVSTESGDQGHPNMCHVGNGSVIIVWDDQRTDSGDIYAQMVNSTGHVQWSTNGTPICTEANAQIEPKICSDGAGGVIVTWLDSRGSDKDIYIQRINATGHPQWDANGTAICTAGNDQDEVRIISDGKNGAIVTWRDFRAGTFVYAQRVNSSGHPNWTTNGELICSVTANHYEPELCGDGDGGALITWYHDDLGTDDLYVQKLNSTGALQWDTNGITVCNATGDQLNQKICTDGAGGAIIVWEDQRNSSDYDIYVQRINATGHPQWDANGTAICTLEDDQALPRIISDGTGGAITTWYTLYGTLGVRVQKISSSGTPLWSTNGVHVATAGPNSQYNPELCSDGAGGTFVTWCDITGDIYAQRIDATGARQAGASGVAVCTVVNGQGDKAICNISADEAVIVWTDFRNGDDDIYAQHVSIAGETPGDGGIPGFGLLFACFGILTTIAIYRQKINLKK